VEKTANEFLCAADKNRIKSSFYQAEEGILFTVQKMNSKSTTAVLHLLTATFLEYHSDKCLEILENNE